MPAPPTSLGTQRDGTGVVIDSNGLILTIGYLILEASEVEISGVAPEPVPARIVAYDHESGFGLLRAAQPLQVAPIPLGASAEVESRQPMMVVSRAGELDAAGVYVVDRRDFAGYWEYLLEDAIFTAPPHAQFGGAALINREGRLVGIGSLFVNDAGFQERPIPGNMFVPIDHLKPIMADLLTRGRRADPGRPWLGVTLEEHQGRVFVTAGVARRPGGSRGHRAERSDPGDRRRPGEWSCRLLSQALGPRRGRDRGAARRAAGDGSRVPWSSSPPIATAICA